MNISVPALSDPTHKNGPGALPEPSDDLLGKVAGLLRVADLFEHTTARTHRLRVMTIAGPTGRKILQVPLDVPMRQLAAGLGAEVGAPVVAAVTVHGERIAPSSTLDEAGVRAGSVIVLSSPDAPPAQRHPSPTTGPRRPPRYERRQRPQPRQVNRPRRSPLPWIGLLTATAALIAGSMFVGAAVLGRIWPPRSTPAASQAMARRVALAWLDATNFTGARRSSVPADLTRDGKPIAAHLEPVAFSTRQRITEGLFIADPTSGRPFGLSVVISNGKLAYPPSVTGLPFATSIPPGREPTVPESGRVVTPGLTAAAQRWADQTFRPAGSTGLALSLAGKVKVLDQWKPQAGPSMVVRVSVPLAAALPGRLNRAERDGSTRFTSVYDVTFTSAGRAIAWAPADYKIGGNG